MARIIHPKDVEHLGKKDNVDEETLLRDRSIDDLVKYGTLITADPANPLHQISTIAHMLYQVNNAIRNGGYAASVPELITAKCRVPHSSSFWGSTILADSEEHFYGHAEDKRFASFGASVLIVVHGASYSTPHDWNQEGEVVGSQLRYITWTNPARFQRVKEGKLPSKDIPVYTVEQIQRDEQSKGGFPYSVIVSEKEIKTLMCQKLDKAAFLQDPLVIARAGSVAHLETYFDLITSIRLSPFTEPLLPGATTISVPPRCSFLAVPSYNSHARWPDLGDPFQMCVVPGGPRSRT